MARYKGERRVVLATPASAAFKPNSALGLPVKLIIFNLANLKARIEPALTLGFRRHREVFIRGLMLSGFLAASSG